MASVLIMFFYADDLCLMAPSPSGLQNLINLCSDFGTSNCILFNPLKSMYLVFKPKGFKLSIPPVFLYNDVIPYCERIRYLGFMLADSLSDDIDITKQLRTLYMRANSLLRTFHHCTTDVKLELARAYCACFYCPSMWTKYNKATFSKLRVAYNNVYRRILGLPRHSSASEMYVANDLDNIEAMLRKNVYSFKSRMCKSRNLLIKCLVSCSFVVDKCWRHWTSILYTVR